MSVVVGVDAGGTKTDVLIAGPDGVRSRVLGPAANHEVVGWAVAGARLAELVAEARAQAPGAVAASVWGLAGLDSADDEQRYAAAVADIGLTGPTRVVNDAELVLEAAVEPRPGVALVSGTGTVAFARAEDGRTARTFGVGAGRGDWGSGGDVVRAAAVAIAEAELGTGPPTALTELALERSGATSVAAYVHGVWREGHHHLVPPDVWELASRGDVVAGEIADRVAGSLAAAVRYAAGRVGLNETEVTLAGRVLDPGHRVLHDRLVAALPGCTVRRLGVAPVAGAALAAARLAGWSPDELATMWPTLP